MSNDLIEEAIDTNLFMTSFLILQEMAFVLDRLGVAKEVIKENVDVFFKFDPLICRRAHFQRALMLTDKIGFRNINDCIHTAIAEEYRIKQHSHLDITVLRDGS